MYKISPLSMEHSGTYSCESDGLNVKQIFYVRVDPSNGLSTDSTTTTTISGDGPVSVTTATPSDGMFRFKCPLFHSPLLPQSYRCSDVRHSRSFFNDGALSGCRSHFPNILVLVVVQLSINIDSKSRHAPCSPCYPSIMLHSAHPGKYYEYTFSLAVRATTLY